VFGRVIPDVRVPSTNNPIIQNNRPRLTLLDHQRPPSCINPRLLQLSNGNAPPQLPVTRLRRASEIWSDLNRPSFSHVGRHSTDSQPLRIEPAPHIAAPAAGPPMAPYRTARPTNQPFGMTVPPGSGRSAPQQQYPQRVADSVLPTHITQGNAFEGPPQPPPLPPSISQPDPFPSARARMPATYRSALRYTYARAARAQVDSSSGISADLAHRLWLVGGPRPPPGMLGPTARLYREGGTRSPEAGRSRHDAGENGQENHMNSQENNRNSQEQHQNDSRNGQDDRTDRHEDGHSDQDGGHASVEPPEPEEQVIGREPLDAEPSPDEADEEKPRELSPERYQSLLNDTGGLKALQ
jgi:hypothetical protein